MVLSWNTLPRPSGVDERIAVTELAGQDKFTVVVFTGFPAELGQVVPENREGFTSNALNSLIAPYAPFTGTVRVPALEVMVRVAVSNVVAGASEALNWSDTWQVLGAVINPVQLFPVTTKSAE